MKKYLKFVITGLVLFLVQALLANCVSGFPGSPNLLFLGAVLMVTSGEDAKAWLLSGVIWQFFWDMAFGFFTGVGAWPLAAVLGLVLLGMHFVNADSPVIREIFLALATILYGVFGWILLHLFGSPYSFGTMMRFYGVQLIYNLVLGAIVLFIFVLRENRKPRRKKNNWYIS